MDGITPSPSAETISALVTSQSFVRSIVYGSVATPIKKPETEHTHRWTVYVRGFNDEDISYYVNTVHFKLHESFADHNRCVAQFPFEVTETGWGEFQIQIKITFQDPLVKPLLLLHHLRLYPPNEEPSQLKTSKPVVAETYDEIIFDPATEMMSTILSQNALTSDVKTSARYPALMEAQANELDQVKVAMEKIQQQLKELKQVAQSRPGSTEPSRVGPEVSASSAPAAALASAANSEAATELTSGPDQVNTPNLRRRKR